MPQSSKAPLIFISHDTRDARVAEAFSDLLLKVSQGVLKSFRSSDRSSAQGIDYGDEWYPALKARLRDASDVVCLLTDRSVGRPWILYEAGMAKGKPNTPVYGIALGISLDCANDGPFAQFQNCADDEESLTKLLDQMIRSRVQNSQPDRQAIAIKVRDFRKRVAKILKDISENEPSPSALPAALQKLADNWKRYIQTHPNEPNPHLFKLFSFCGLTDSYESESSPEADLEDIYFLWADGGAGNSIRARVLRDGGKRIEIRFDSKAGGHSGNVALRIKGRNRVHKPDRFNLLTFSARIPLAREADDLAEVQLGIRIVDALKTHWMYSYLEGYRPIYVNNPEPEQWQQFSVELARGKWQVFETDGNSLYHDERPDFSDILALIVEVGGRNALRPGPGKGVVELKDLAAG